MSRARIDPRGRWKAPLLRAGVIAGWAGALLGAWVAAEAIGAPATSATPWNVEAAHVPDALPIFAAIGLLGAAVARRSPASAMGVLYICGSIGFALAGTAWIAPGSLMLAAAFAILAGLD